MEMENLTIIGLILGILGATFLVAPNISRKDWDKITRSESDETIKKKNRKALVSWLSTLIGFLLLMFGFILQFLAISLK